MGIDNRTRKIPNTQHHPAQKLKSKAEIKTSTPTIIVRGSPIHKRATH